MMQNWDGIIGALTRGLAIAKEEFPEGNDELITPLEEMLKIAKAQYAIAFQEACDRVFWETYWELQEGKRP